MRGIEQVLDAVENDQTRLDVRIRVFGPDVASGETLTCIYTGRHVDDVRLSRNTLEHGFFRTRLVACFGRATSNQALAGFPGEDASGDGEALGESCIAL